MKRKLRRKKNRGTSPQLRESVLVESIQRFPGDVSENCKLSITYDEETACMASVVSESLLCVHTIHT